MSSYADRLAELQATVNPFYTHRTPNAFDIAGILLKEIDPTYHFNISVNDGSDIRLESEDHGVTCIIGFRGIDRLELKGDRTTLYSSVILPSDEVLTDCATKINQYLHSHS